MITSFIKHKMQFELPTKIIGNPASWLAGGNACLLADFP